jgi:hypothetical protein
MPALADLQCAFLAALANGESEEIETLIDGRAPGAKQRLAIYRNNVRSNLCNALRIGFPVVERLVGAEFFSWLANGFIDRHPSRSGNLDRYGAEFPQFIREFDRDRDEPALAALPYLGDVAQLEWLIDAVMTAPDDVVDIDAQDELPPYMRLLQSPYPVHRIWQVNQPDWQNDEAVSLEEGGVNLLIHRHTTLTADAPDRHELLLQPLSDEQFCTLYE